MLRESVLFITELKVGSSSIRGNPVYKFVPVITGSLGERYELGNWRYFPANNGEIKGPMYRKFGKDNQIIKLSDEAKWDLKYRLEALILERENSEEAKEIVGKCFRTTEKHLFINSSKWAEQELERR